MNDRYHKYTVVCHKHYIYKNIQKIIFLPHMKSFISFDCGHSEDFIILLRLQ